MMSNKNPTILDEITEGMRRFLEDMERIFNPEKAAQRQRIPVRVRINPHHERMRRNKR